MTPEEIRADVERVLEHIYAAYWGGTQSEKRFIGERRIDILLAARKRWRNEGRSEALEEAAKTVPTKILRKLESMKRPSVRTAVLVCEEELQALKEEK